MISALVHQPRSRRLWRALLVVLLAVVSWLAFGPPPPAPDLHDGDKINHLVAFMMLALTATFCGQPGRWWLLVVAAGLVLYGGFIEIVQWRLPHRDGDWADFAADALGIAVGLALAGVLRRSVPVPTAVEQELST